MTKRGRWSNWRIVMTWFDGNSIYERDRIIIDKNGEQILEIQQDTMKHKTVANKKKTIKINWIT